jgi:hypothetical protein
VRGRYLLGDLRARRFVRGAPGHVSVVRAWPLVLVPFAALIYGPLYVRTGFYVFEAACVLLAAVLSWFVYRPASVPARQAPMAAEEEPRFSRDPAIRRLPSARRQRSLER